MEQDKETRRGETRRKRRRTSRVFLLVSLSPPLLVLPERRTWLESALQILQAGSRVRTCLRRFFADEGGMETVEWGVVAALIVGAVITALTALGSNVLRQFNVMVNATQ